MGRAVSELVNIIASIKSILTTNRIKETSVRIFFGQKLHAILLLAILVSACAPSVGPSPTIPAVSPSAEADNMALIPAGKFTMGDSVDQAMAECQKYRPDCQQEWFATEAPAHIVDLPAFYMDVYEVTNVLYRACVTANSCKPPRLTGSATRSSYYDNAQYDNFPVVDVDWSNATAYCQWRGARLPSEAEWEKAARGTDERIFPWGNNQIDPAYANYGDSKINDTVAVGSYASGKSPYGIYDLAGNVWEWVNDWYDVYPGGNASASADFGQKLRVLRGGGWSDPGNTIRSAYRGQLDPTHSFGNIGFRCAHSVP